MSAVCCLIGAHGRLVYQTADGHKVVRKEEHKENTTLGVGAEHARCDVCCLIGLLSHWSAVSLICCLMSVVCCLVSAVCCLIALLGRLVYNAADGEDRVVSKEEHKENTTCGFGVMSVVCCLIDLAACTFDNGYRKLTRSNVRG